MKYKISRIERANYEWHSMYFLHDEKCPICGRFWVSLKKDYKLYRIEEQRPKSSVPAGKQLIWSSWTPKEAVVCSSRCVDMWILQNL